MAESGNLISLHDFSVQITASCTLLIVSSVRLVLEWRDGDIME